MKIKFVDIQNFRKLKSTHIDFSDSTTVFVGANNSGKTSAMYALKSFLIDGTRLSIRDFTVSNLEQINKIGEAWEAGATDNPLLDDWVPVLPTLDVWLEVADVEIHHVVNILPSLEWTGGILGVRLRYEPKDVAELANDFCASRVAAKVTREAANLDGDQNEDFELWPAQMEEFLDRRLAKHFAVKAYPLDPAKLQVTEDGLANPQSLDSESEPFERAPFRGLIQIDEIYAQRGFSDPTSADRAEFDFSSGERGYRAHKRKLSEQLRTYYAQHLDPSKSPTPSDVGALQAISQAQKTFDETLSEGFAEALTELQGLGYPGMTDPKLNISTKIQLTDGLKHDSAVRYEVSRWNLEEGEQGYLLPESYNGLGYQNLISMTFTLMSFRDQWMRVGKASTLLVGKDQKDGYPPLHLVLLEEPEAHLHAQVQQVFIRKAYAVLRNHELLGSNDTFCTQLIVSTHSSHIAHETDFAFLRYFRRQPATVNCEVPTTAVVNLSRVFGSPDETSRFVTRYLRATHCDLFFADAAILVEGSAERILVPEFIDLHYPELHERYITLLEIGGSHAHRLRPLIEELGLTTLIIADIDASQKQENGRYKATRPLIGAGQVTQNKVLSTWHPKLSAIDELAAISDDNRKKIYNESFTIYVTYQRTVNVDLGESKGDLLPSTFEDALALENIVLFAGFQGGSFANKLADIVGSTLDVTELGNRLFEAVRKGTKAELALDLLSIPDAESIKPPEYISVGLSWLQTQFERKQLDSPPNATELASQSDAGANG